MPSKERQIRESYALWSQGEDEAPLGRQHATNKLRFDEFRMEVRDVLTRGDTFLVAVTMSGVDKESGQPFHRDIYHLWTIRDGHAPTMTAFVDEADAYAALEKAV